MTERAWRGKESLEYELQTRAKIIPFLESKGFKKFADRSVRIGSAQKQSIECESPDNLPVLIRVKLCWRQRGIRPGKSPYQAAQLIAKIKDGDWEGSLKRYSNAAEKEGVTHFLFLGQEDDSISHAALVPRSALIPIWTRQSEISDKLIQRGKLGNRRKNHAKNGSSPTVWLQDRLAPEVTDALWKFKGVTDLMETQNIQIHDDSIDDLPGCDPSLYGSDGARRVAIMASGVKRDPRVRKEVLKRANGRCERTHCGIKREFASFFDVHHILGADVSDRVYNCVAICPNCHREAHFSPDSAAINRELLAFAMQFR